MKLFLIIVVALWHFVWFGTLDAVHLQKSPILKSQRIFSRLVKQSVFNLQKPTVESLHTVPMSNQQIKPHGNEEEGITINDIVVILNDDSLMDKLNAYLGKLSEAEQTTPVSFFMGFIFYVTPVGKKGASLEITRFLEIELDAEEKSDCVRFIKAFFRKIWPTEEGEELCALMDMVIFDLSEEQRSNPTLFVREMMVIFGEDHEQKQDDEEELMDWSNASKVQNTVTIILQLWIFTCILNAALLY